MAIRGNLRVHHLALISMIIGFLSGYDSGVAGGILTFESFQRDFGYTKAQSTAVNSYTVSLQVLGDFVSCLYAWWVTEKLGRRYGVMVFSGIFLVGVVLQVAPTNRLGAWYFARIVSGLGQGGLMITVPIFTAEMAPKHLRGRLGSLYQWQYTLGIFTAYWIDYGMQQDIAGSQSKQWQIPIGLQMIPGALLFAGMFSVPESVRWLLKKDRQDEAWRSLVWIRASEDAAVVSEFEEMKLGLAAEKQLKTGLRRSEIFTGDNRGRLAIGILAFVFQIATGATALAYFSPQFFALLVGSGPRDLLLTALFGAIKLIACSIFILFFANRWGRKKPLVFGGFTMAACMLSVAVILRTVPIANSGPVPPAAQACIALIFLAIMAYNCSWGPIPWALVPEIFPNRTREMGVGICLAMQHVMQFVFTFSTPYMLAATGVHGWGTFLFYAVFDLLMALWVVFYMPETHGKSLERVNAEIDRDDTLLAKAHPDATVSSDDVAAAAQDVSSSKESKV